MSSTAFGVPVCALQVLQISASAKIGAPQFEQVSPDNLPTEIPRSILAVCALMGSAAITRIPTKKLKKKDKRKKPTALRFFCLATFATTKQRTKLAMKNIKKTIARLWHEAGSFWQRLI